MPEDQIIDLPVIGRAGSLRSVDEAARTFEVLWTTGAQVRRYSWARDEEFDEELLVTPGAMRLERLNGGAPFLNSHASWSLRSILGVVEEGSIRRCCRTQPVKDSHRESMRLDEVHEQA